MWLQRLNSFPPRWLFVHELSKQHFQSFYFRLLILKILELNQLFFIHSYFCSQILHLFLQYLTNRKLYLLFDILRRNSLIIKLIGLMVQYFLVIFHNWKQTLLEYLFIICSCNLIVHKFCRIFLSHRKFG